jgi:hypothetical protein
VRSVVRKWSWKKKRQLLNPRPRPRPTPQLVRNEAAPLCVPTDAISTAARLAVDRLFVLMDVGSATAETAEAHLSAHTTGARLLAKSVEGRPSANTVDNERSARTVADLLYVCTAYRSQSVKSAEALASARMDGGR